MTDRRHTVLIGNDWAQRTHTSPATLVACNIQPYVEAGPPLPRSKRGAYAPHAARTTRAQTRAQRTSLRARVSRTGPLQPRPAPPRRLRIRDAPRTCECTHLHRSPRTQARSPVTYNDDRRCRDACYSHRIVVAPPEIHMHAERGSAAAAAVYCCARLLRAASAGRQTTTHEP